MRRILLCMVVLFALAGCGAASTSTVPTPPACSGHVNPGMGDCIRQQLRARVYQLTAPAKASPAPQGVDISRWQALPSFGAAPAAVRFVMVQTNDGPVTNPFFWAQVTELNEHHIPWGTYTFMEGYSGARQAQLSNQIAAGHGRKLGMWADSEQEAAYAHTCEYVNAAASVSYIVGQYGSPGTSRSGHCRGYEWPAEWGSGRAYPFDGYPASAVIVRQWCGTCRVAGFEGEVDRDEALGILSLASPPESNAQHAARVHRERVARLRQDIRQRHALDGALRHGNCLHGYDHYTRRHRSECTAWRARHGQLSRDIKRLNHLGIH